MISLAVVAIKVGTDLCTYTDTIADLNVLDLVSDLDGTACEWSQSSFDTYSWCSWGRREAHRESCAFVARRRKRGDGANVVSYNVPMISCPTQRGSGVSPQPPVIAVFR